MSRVEAREFCPDQDLEALDEGPDSGLLGATPAVPAEGLDSVVGRVVDPGPGVNAFALPEPEDEPQQIEVTESVAVPTAVELGSR